MKLCVTNTVGDAYDECVNQFVAEETEGGPSLVTSLLFVRLDQSNLAVSRKVWPEVSNIVFVAENVRVESGSTENDMIFDEFYFIYSTEIEEQPKTAKKVPKLKRKESWIHSKTVTFHLFTANRLKKRMSNQNILHNLGYFGHNEKEFKSEEKTKLVISMNSPSSPPFYPLIIIFQVISSQVIF